MFVLWFYLWRAAFGPLQGEKWPINATKVTYKFQGTLAGHPKAWEQPPRRPRLVSMSNKLGKAGEPREGPPQKILKASSRDTGPTMMEEEEEDSSL